MPPSPRPKRKPDYLFGINLNPDPLPPGVPYPKHLSYLACQPTRRKKRGDHADGQEDGSGAVAQEAKPQEGADPTSKTEKVKKISVREGHRKIGFLASLLPLGVAKMSRELDMRDRRVKEWVEGPGSGEYGSESGCSSGFAVREDGGEGDGKEQEEAGKREDGEIAGEGAECVSDGGDGDESDGDDVGEAKPTALAKVGKEGGSGK